VAIGAGGVATLQAQSKAPAYFVTETLEVSDQAGFMKAIQDANPLHKAHGGRYLVLGGKIAALHGEQPKRLTIVAFETFDQANTWLRSAEYAPIDAAVQKVAKTRSFIVEGVAP
jgi:uncharacterized protein (DUF1330 family)